MAGEASAAQDLLQIEVVAGTGPAGRTAGHLGVAVLSLVALEAAAGEPQRTEAVAERTAVHLTAAVQSLVDLAARPGKVVVAGREIAVHTVDHSAAGLVAACLAGTCRSDPAYSCSSGQVPDSAKVPSVLVQVSASYSSLSGPAKASVALCQVLVVRLPLSGDLDAVDLVQGQAAADAMAFVVHGTADFCVMLDLGVVTKVSPGLVVDSAATNSTFVECADLLGSLAVVPVLGTLVMVVDGGDGDDVLVLVDLATSLADVAVVLVGLLAMADDGDDGDDVLVFLDLATFLAAVALTLAELLAMVVGGAVDLVARGPANVLSRVVVLLVELLAMVVEVAVLLVLVEIVDSLVVNVLVTAVFGDGWAASFGDDRGGR